MTVKLSLRDLSRVRRIARDRQRDNERAGRETLRMTDRYSDTDLHVIGAFCEVAVAKALRQQVHLERFRGQNSEFRAATAVADVAEWEIKGTILKNGRLLVPAHLSHKHDLDRKYLLVRADLSDRSATIVGWAYGREFIGRKHCLLSWLPRPAYCPLSLHPFEGI